MKNKKVLIYAIVSTIILAIISIVLIRTNLIKKISVEKRQEEQNIENISYKVFDNTTENIQGLLFFKDNNGIQNIKYKQNDGEEYSLDCNGKTQVAIDKVVKMGDEIVCKYTTEIGTYSKNIKIDSDLIDKYVEINLENSDLEFDTATINYDNEEQILSKNYKIGEKEKWTEFDESELDVSYVDDANSDDVNKVTVYAKQTTSKGTIVNSKVLDITPSKYRKKRYKLFEDLTENNQNLNDAGLELISVSGYESYGFDVGNIYVYRTHGKGTTYMNIKYTPDNKNDMCEYIKLYLSMWRGIASNSSIAHLKVNYTDETYDEGYEVLDIIGLYNRELNIQIDRSKTVNYIEMELSGWDPVADGSMTQTQILEIEYAIKLQPIH